MTLSATTLNELAHEPEKLVSVPLDDLFTLQRSDYQALQLAALKTRFHDLRNKIPALKRLADSLDVNEITTLPSAAPLMFQHVVYKSYPLAFIERCDFARLTRWLNELTAHDLSHVDVSPIESIDGWLQYLDENSALRVVHSTGTSGKLSFLPRSTTELPVYVKGLMNFYKGFKEERDLTPRGISMVIPGYRRGFNAGPRIIQAMVEELGVNEEDCITLHDFISADLMSLGGRLRTAEAKGETGKLTMNKQMLALRDRLAGQKQNQEDVLQKFFDRAVNRFRGKPVFIMSTVPQLYHIAEAARQRGVSRVFAETSIVHTGGGMKGENLPSNFMEIICDFIGVKSVREAYGMTETMGFMGKCPGGYFHVPPQLIPYLLDPDSGALMPDSGVQSGRFGFIDLLPQTYWGGFLTGDFLTLDWDVQCKCGRSGGPVIHPKVERLSEKRGGDDKISCAGGADEAHDKAIEFLSLDA